MSAIKGKSGNRPQNGPIPGAGTALVDRSMEVLTVSEAAAYLRVAEADVLRLVHLHDLPGRQIGNEWRFLKAGLRDWLRTPARKSGKEAFVAIAGAWKDDPDIEEIVREAHRRRGRPVTENEE
jgi:excisionase family DNA binding protein